MLKNGQAYFKNSEVFIPQDFQSMSDDFSTLCMKELTGYFSDSSTVVQIPQI